jgi:hypothetical protein
MEEPKSIASSEPAVPTVALNGGGGWGSQWLYTHVGIKTCMRILMGALLRKLRTLLKALMALW